MPIRVDLPAPFSPTMPWIVPARTTSATSRLAWTSPNHLSMPRSSIADGATRSTMFVPRLPGHVVGDLDLAGHDVGARLLEPLLHLRGDQAAGVLIERVADPALGDAQRAHAALQGAVLGGLERFVDREIDALDHRGQD